jgi:hypothetical protein
LCQIAISIAGWVRYARTMRGSVLEVKEEAFLEDYDDIKAVLNLHSVSIGDFKLLVYTKDDSDNTGFALRLSSIPLHFVFYPEHMLGALIEAAGAHGIRGLIVECGNHYAKQAVETARQHIHNFLARIISLTKAICCKRRLRRESHFTKVFRPSNPMPILHFSSRV